MFYVICRGNSRIARSQNIIEDMRLLRSSTYTSPPPTAEPLLEEKPFRYTFTFDFAKKDGAVSLIQVRQPLRFAINYSLGNQKPSPRLGKVAPIGDG